MMKTSERLKERLNSELGLEVFNIQRVPRGRHQAAAGQFAWSGTLINKTVVGSEDTMTDCVNAKSLQTHRPCGFSGAINVSAENN